MPSLKQTFIGSAYRLTKRQVTRQTRRMLCRVACAEPADDPTTRRPDDPTPAHRTRGFPAGTTRRRRRVAPASSRCHRPDNPLLQALRGATHGHPWRCVPVPPFAATLQAGQEVAHPFRDHHAATDGVCSGTIDHDQHCTKQHQPALPLRDASEVLPPSECACTAISGLPGGRQRK